MEEIDGIKVFTEKLEYWRFIQGFKGDLHPDDDEGLYITGDKRIYYYGKLIGLYKSSMI